MAGTSRSAPRQAAAWLWLLAAGLGQAQSPPTLAPIQVTGSLLPAPLESSAADVVVIDRATIERLQPPSVAALLRRVPGLHLDRGDGAGGVSSLYLRGADPNYTLVLVDGVRMNDPGNSRGGAFDFNELDASEIERIEIVRGPLSALYGADAMAGAIHIITRAPQAGARGRVEISSRGSHALQAGMGLNDTYGLHLGRREFADTRLGSGRLDSASANARWVFGDADELRLDLRHGERHDRGFPEDSGSFRHALLRALERRESEQWNAAAAWQHLPAQGLGYRLRLDAWQRDAVEISPGVAPGLRDPFGLPASRLATDSDRQRVQALLHHRQAHHALSVGIEAQREQGAMRGRLDFGSFEMPTDFSQRRDNRAWFAEWQYRPGPEWSWLLGLRQDRGDDGDTVSSPRLGLTYRSAEQARGAHLSWGKGYKLPSLFALGHPLIGNPALRPEFSRSVSGGVQQGFADGLAELRFDAFSSEYRDAIDFDPGPPPRLVNRSQLRTRGVEFGLTLHPRENLQTLLSLSHVHSRVSETGAAPRSRPAFTAHLGLHWQPALRHELSAELLHVGRQRDSSIPTGDRDLPEYSRVDLRWQRRLDPHWRLEVAVDNLFDRHYEEYIGAPVAGRALRLAVAAQF